MFGMNLQGWTAWMPAVETPAAWLDWARSGAVAPPVVAEAPPPIREIPPLLRRRAERMGRALLHVLSRPELPYAGQPLILCSRLGEFPRSLALLRELARDGQVSPQQFSMSVHNAAGGLFMMAQKANAPLTALAAAEETALAGLQEAAAQLADGAASVWLCFSEEPLPEAYRLLDTTPQHTDYFALLLEFTTGEAFCLQSEIRVTAAPASPLQLLRFLLLPEEETLCLSPRGGWTLRRQSVSGSGDAR
ncbi:MAG: beta-ketoacyl synthase chain length factor [Zoogloeaceae bacterium]|nr:beta-ketoacyl synthase chain length factor [Zoogloeaceae bacterium]